MANRSSKGNPTAQARSEHGNAQGKFPIFDEKSARSAIKLRHHGKGVSAGSVLSRVASWARKNNKQAILEAVARAREADKQR